MGKIFGILMIVLGVWIGLEIFTKGSDEAFGGLFASGGRAVGAPVEPQESPLARIGNSVQKSADAAGARATNGLDDETADESDDEE